MKIHPHFKIFLLVAVLFFLAGYGANHFMGGNKKTPERKILYYVDPMNPAYRSDKPGISPACGMPLEPVYADGAGAAGLEKTLLKSMPPGTIRVTPEKQQIIGVKTATVEKASWRHSQRVLGRVIPDETRIYRINAAIGGSIQEVSPVTTGSLVKKDELLATFYSPESRSNILSYFKLLKSSASTPAVEREIDGKRLKGPSPIESYRKILLNYGMTTHQLEEMERTDIVPETVDIRAPVSGFVLSRNVSAGLFFDRGAEFFRIADLSQVWIQADIFENEAALFKPGTWVKAELPYRKKFFYAKISQVLPQFDPATRTLKIRLTADNPGYVLRPDMMVNLEFSMSGPPAVIVSADAVLDSGLKKTVFVDRGNGFFEPREVETGRSLGERIEITRGIMAGEKIVIAGNFLLDSETRLQSAGVGKTGKISRDSVCGMDIDENLSRRDGNFRDYQGKTYFFCSPECLSDFVGNPSRYSNSSPSEDNKKILLADPKKEKIVQKSPGASMTPEPIRKEDPLKPAKGMGRPKSSDSGLISKPNPPSHNHGMIPDGKSASPPGGPSVQKTKNPAPEFVTPPQPVKGSSAPPPGMPSPTQSEQGSRPFPGNSSLPKEGSGFPGQTAPPMMISPPESRPGEVSRPKAGEIRRSQGRRPYPMSTPPEAKPGGLPPSLSNIPPETKIGEKSAQ